MARGQVVGYSLSMITRTDSIPIILLAGFLGSGKTSLLNNLLAQSRGLKIGVIVNDFGKINIDNLLVSAQTDTSLELNNGCICCSVEDGELDDAVGQLAHRGSSLDLIVIEASGLAEPKELVALLQMMGNQYSHFESLVTVVDAANFEHNNKQSASSLENLSISDFVIINKVDLVSKKQLKDIETVISLASPNVRILRSEHGKVDINLLVDARKATSPKVQLPLHSEEEHSHLHDEFSSVEFTSKKPLDHELFLKWADSLPTNVFRAKGICYFGMKGLGQKYIFQAVGPRYDIKLDEWTSSEEPQTTLVVIGKDLDKSKTLKALEATIDSLPDDINSETIIDIFKYK